jgi:hypothetical protein
VISPGSPCLPAQHAATLFSHNSLPWQVSGGSPPGSPGAPVYPSLDSQFMPGCDQYCINSIDKSMDHSNPSSMHSDVIGTGVFWEEDIRRRK